MGYTASKVFVRRAAIAALAISVMAGTAVAQWKPDKRITVLVAYQAGGGADSLARLLVEAISKERGWNLIVENKTGAGGGIMLTQLTKSAPDGLTVGVAATGSISTAPLFVTSLKYGPQDFTFLGTMAKTQMAMIAASNAPFNTLEEFAAYASKKGSASVAVLGPEIGLVARLIAKHYKIDLSIVPTKGGAETLIQSAAGHVDAAFNAGAHHAMVQEGKLKVIANLNDTPLVLTPKAKSLKDSGINYVSNVYFQLQGPAGMPADIQRAWAEAIDTAIKSPAYLKIARDRLLMDVVNLGPQKLTDLMIRETADARKLVEAAK